MTALAAVPTIARAKPHETGLDIPDGISYDDWLGIGEQLATVAKRTAWAVADWLCYGEDVFGSEVYDEAEKLFPQVERRTLRSYASTARRVSIRMDVLSLAHHEQVASLPPSEQRTWLDRCARERISKNRLAELLATDRAARDLPPATPKPKLILTLDADSLAAIEAKAEVAGQSLNEWCVAVLLAA